MQHLLGLILTTCNAISCAQCIASGSISLLSKKTRDFWQQLIDMKNEDWSTLIKHATKCSPGVEIYSYRVAEENTELLFNDFYDLVGMMIDGFYVPVNDLDQFQQVCF